ncbi:MAG: hypothetical protein LUO96_02495, partial [Methanomicrobiales archaeon]|nr:hypothetical protein [Methanomicrobiales archaeon]
DVEPVTPSNGCLWPPNHKYADVTLVGVTDPDGDPVTVTITSVMSDELTASEEGSGGDLHAPDASGVGSGAATLLRAERSGNNNGRVYTIFFTATDGLIGGTSSGSVTVCVPHDQDAGCTCIDDGPLYDATAMY